MSASSVRGRTLAALSVRNFRLYFIGQLISVSGTWMQTVAQGLLVYQLTHKSAFALSIAVALQWLPMLALASFGGMVADRNEKRHILYFTQTAAGLLALALGVLVSTHHDSLGVIYGLALGLGVVNLFDNPARQAFVQEMVGRELITNAVSLNSVLMNMGRLLGPMIVGVALSVFSLATCFYLNAASYLAVLVALALMRSADLNRIRTVRRAKRQMREGLAYVRGEPLLRDVLVAAFVVGLFGFNFTITLIALAEKTFHGGHLAYTALMTGMGLGAVVGGLFIAHRSRPTMSLLAILGTTFGVFMTAVALAPSLALAVALMVPTGATSIAFISTANALLQLNSREEMRGRVMSLYGQAFLGTTPLGAIIVGAVISWSNARAGLLVGSILTLATGLWLLLLVRHQHAPAGAVVTTSA